MLFYFLRIRKLAGFEGIIYFTGKRKYHAATAPLCFGQWSAAASPGLGRANRRISCL
jgi:hypothetical protein